MGWFRRPQGRHAAGRAPAVPVAGAVLAAAPEPWLASPLPFAASLPAAPAPPVADTGDVYGSIAALISTGEAWADPARAVAPPAPAPVPVPVAAPAPVPVPAPPPALAPAAAPRPLPSVDLLPRVEPLATVPAQPSAPEPSPHVSRVNLGFRDGTSADLDPASEQAAALEELALLLSLRD